MAADDLLLLSAFFSCLQNMLHLCYNNDVNNYVTLNDKKSDCVIVRQNRLKSVAYVGLYLGNMKLVGLMA